MDQKQDISAEGQHDFSPSFAFYIVPPLYSSIEHTLALEATMQSLVLDRRHPIALELAGTARHRRFIVRATSKAALDHAESLLRAQYPQSEINPLNVSEDPFRLDPDEAITAVELVAGASPVLPLRTWQESQKEGTDPLLGLLAALGHLPDRTRVVSQVSLIPAISNWSRWNLRRAIESPLEAEHRSKERQRMVALFSSDNYGNILLVNIGILVGIFLLLRSYIPGWLWGAVIKIATGKGAQLPAAQSHQVYLFLGAILLIEALLILGYIVFNSLYKRRVMYDPHVIAQKISRMVYRTRLRLYVIGPKKQGGTAAGSEQSMMRRLSDERAQSNVRQELLLRIVAAYRQFHMANGAFFVPKRISATEISRIFVANAEGGIIGWQRGLRNSRHMVSVDSLASLWHMPHPHALPELALVEQRRARTLLIPPTVSQQVEGLPPIGYSIHAGYRLPFALTPEFFLFHTLIGGKAGEGKSMFIQHIAQKAMQLDGLVLIDPFGDLCENVLQLVPPERSEDVVFIDLSDTMVSIGLNPLDVTLGHSRDKFIADLMKMLAQLWASSWTARMENAFEMSLRTLFEANQALVRSDTQRGPALQYTLLDVLPLLTNVNFCHALLQEIRDDYLHRWWREYYEPLSAAQQRDVINPIAAKVGKFESIIARRILGQSISTLNIPQMINERKIILFKLARGIVGNEVASMVGATLLGLIQSTLEAQGRRERMGSVRLPIIIDEFQRVAGADYRTLSELHKYGATFFLATQSFEYLQKVNTLLWPTLQANVRQMVAFNMSAQDAAFLSKELGVDQEDILHLDINSCYVSVLAAGKRQPTFSLNLKSAATANVEQAESIRTRCRVRYTSPIAEVDDRLSAAMLRSIRMVPQPDPLPPPNPPTIAATPDPAPVSNPLEERGRERNAEHYQERSTERSFERERTAERKRERNTERTAERERNFERERTAEKKREKMPEIVSEKDKLPDVVPLGNAFDLEDMLGYGDLDEMELMEINAYNVANGEEDGDDDLEEFHLLD
jgi:hypothetical protein